MSSTVAAGAYLPAFMNVYWLRPETAAWRTLDCLALQDMTFQPPILDLGCGDGLFSFVRAGGQLSLDYDMFLQTADLDAFFEKRDIYDHFDSASVRPLVTARPRYMIDVGFDHKAALLSKAGLLGLYRTTEAGDANAPLPFADGSFRTIYSNIIYWLDRLPNVLAELNRILAPGGQIVIHVPSNTFPDYSFYRRFHMNTGDERWAWLEILDRGRSDSIKHCLADADWRSLFQRVGLGVASARRYLSRTLIEAWDIGLRPISPFLIEMANELSPERRRTIKAKWVNGLLPLVAPLCQLEWPTDAENPPGFFLYVLEKSR